MESVKNIEISNEFHPGNHVDNWNGTLQKISSKEDSALSPLGAKVISSTKSKYDTIFI